MVAEVGRVLGQGHGRDEGQPHSTASRRHEGSEPGRRDERRHGHAHQDEAEPDLGGEAQREPGEGQGQVQPQVAQRGLPPQRARDGHAAQAPDQGGQEQHRGLEGPVHGEVVPDATRMPVAEQHHRIVLLHRHREQVVAAGEGGGHGQAQMGQAGGQARHLR